MNKPLKTLLAVGVLAFTAAGLYYALLAPAKPKTGSPTKPLRLEPKPAEPLIVPGAKVGGELPGSVPAGSAPNPALSAPAASTSAATPASGGVPGFSPVSEPMKPLPASLPGFEPASTGATPAAPAGTQATAPSPTAPPAVAPSQPAIAARTPLPPLPASSTGATPNQAAPTPAPTAVSARPAPAPASPVIPAKPARAETYTVKDGDSIASIWRDLTGSERGYEKLLAANPGVDASRLKIGQVLKVPESAPSSAPATTTAAPARPVTSSGTYIVQSGDTLSSIAAKTLGDRKRWKEIHDANREAIGSDPGALKVGQTLKIPGKSAQAPAASEPKPSATKPLEAKPAPMEPKPAAAPVSAPAVTPSSAPTSLPTPR